MIDLALHGLHSNIKEKLEHNQFLTVNHLLQKVVAVETRLKDSLDIHRSHGPNMHAIEYHSDSLDDDSIECYLAEFAWPPTSKNVTCPFLKPIQKNRKDDMKFTFDLAKCDHIFDEFLRNGYIKSSHPLPSHEALKRRAYCK